MRKVVLRVFLISFSQMLDANILTLVVFFAFRIVDVYLRGKL